MGLPRCSGAACPDSLARCRPTRIAARGMPQRALPDGACGLSGLPAGRYRHAPPAPAPARPVGRISAAPSGTGLPRCSGAACPDCLARCSPTRIAARGMPRRALPDGACGLSGLPAGRYRHAPPAPAPARPVGRISAAPSGMGLPRCSGATCPDSHARCRPTRIAARGMPRRALPDGACGLSGLPAGRYRHAPPAPAPARPVGRISEAPSGMGLPRCSGAACPDSLARCHPTRIAARGMPRRALPDGACGLSGLPAGRYRHAPSARHACGVSGLRGVGVKFMSAGWYLRCREPPGPAGWGRGGGWIDTPHDHDAHCARLRWPVSPGVR
jgi:hypothetical protein